MPTLARALRPRAGGDLGAGDRHAGRPPLLPREAQNSRVERAARGAGAREVALGGGPPRKGGVVTAVKAKVGKAPAERAARADAKKTAKAPPAAVPFVLFGASGMLAGEFLRLCEGTRRSAPHSWCRAIRDRWDPPIPTYRHMITHRPAAPRSRRSTRRGRPKSWLRSSRGRRAAAVFALPHGESPAVWRSLRARLGPLVENLFVVDLAADYRFSDPQLYAGGLRRAARRSRRMPTFRLRPPRARARIVGEGPPRRRPGCFATAMQLAVVPAARAGVLDRARPWILLGITGSSGSGNTPRLGTHHPFRDGNLWVYSAIGASPRARARPGAGALGGDPNDPFQRRVGAVRARHPPDRVAPAEAGAGAPTRHSRRARDLRRGVRRGALRRGPRRGAPTSAASPGATAPRSRSRCAAISSMSS